MLKKNEIVEQLRASEDIDCEDTDDENNINSIIKKFKSYNGIN